LLQTDAGSAAAEAQTEPLNDTVPAALASDGCGWACGCGWEALAGLSGGAQPCQRPGRAPMLDAAVRGAAGEAARAAGAGVAACAASAASASCMPARSGVGLLGRCWGAAASGEPTAAKRLARLALAPAACTMRGDR
jgi:hypothetical protein